MTRYETINGMQTVLDLMRTDSEFPCGQLCAMDDGISLGLFWGPEKMRAATKYLAKHGTLIQNNTAEHVLVGVTIGGVYCYVYDYLTNYPNISSPRYDVPDFTKSEAAAN